MNSNTPPKDDPITPFQLASLAVQIEVKKPEDALPKAKGLLEAAHRLLNPPAEISFLGAVDAGVPKFCDGRPVGEQKKKLRFISSLTSRGDCADVGKNPFGYEVWQILKKRKIGRKFKTDAPTTEEIRKRLANLTKFETDYIDSVKAWFYRPDGECSDWKEAFGISNGKGGFKSGEYDIPVEIAYAVVEIWNENIRSA